jgi:hypothetical protein
MSIEQKEVESGAATVVEWDLSVDHINLAHRVLRYLSQEACGAFIRDRANDRGYEGDCVRYLGNVHNVSKYLHPTDKQAIGIKEIRPCARLLLLPLTTAITGNELTRLSSIIHDDFWSVAPSDRVASKVALIIVIDPTKPEIYEGLLAWLMPRDEDENDSW